MQDQQPTDKFCFDVIKAMVDEHGLATKDAIVCQGQSIKYGELIERVEALSTHLRSFPLTSRQEPVIAVFLQPSIDLIVSMLAIMHSGFTYVPITDYAEIADQRRDKYFGHSGAQQLITNNQLIDHTWLNSDCLQAAEIINLDNLIPKTQPHPKQLSLNTRAYIVFTSGSTGEPKGVEVEHVGLYNCMYQTYTCWGVTPNDRMAMFSTIGFDANIMEALLPLVAGATLVIVPNEVRLDPIALGQYYQRQNVSGAIFTPSMLELLNPDDFPNLKIIISTGEKLNINTLEKWLRRDGQPDRLIINGYGPTEVTIATSLGICTLESGIHIGEPLGGLNVFIANPESPIDQLEVLERNQLGELIIEGVGVARGYLVSGNEQNQQKIRALNQQRFGSSATEDGGNARKWYRTGDLGLIDDDGRLQIKGRIGGDARVKIHGKLYHPQEVDDYIQQLAHLLKLPSIQCHTKIEQPSGSNKTLITTYLFSALPFTQEIVYSFARNISSNLSKALVPYRWKQLRKWPQSSRGKVESSKLDEHVNLTLYSQYPFSYSFEQDYAVVEKMLSLWQDVLQLPDATFKLGFEDNFFFISGTSIKAAMLVRAINQCGLFNGFTITLPEFFTSPTAGSIIRKIRLYQKNLEQVFSAHYPIIELKNPIRSNLKQALFLVPSLHAEVTSDYLNLITQWHYPLPIYGLQAIGYEDPLLAPFSLIDTATIYVRAIRRVQPQGPYLIGGWSLGGTLCAQMAQLFSEMGAQCFIIAIDSICLPLITNKPAKQHAEFLLGFAEHEYPGEIPEQLRSQLLALGKYKQIETLFSALLQTRPEWSSEGWLAIIRRNLLFAGLDYGALSSNINMTLIVTEQTQAEQGDQLLGWDKRMVGKPIVWQGCNHHTLFSEANAPALAEFLHQQCELILSTNLNAERHFQLPAEFKFFCGREQDLLNIERQLNQSKPVVVTGLPTSNTHRLVGSGGIGKTQAAIAFAHMMLKQRRYNRIIYINGGGLQGDKNQLMLQFVDLAIKLGLAPNQHPPNTLVSQVFQRLKQERVLVIFDDIDNPDTLSNFLPNQDHDIPVLITSRDCNDWGNEFSQQPISLFSQQDAEDYVAHHFKTESKQHLIDAEEIKALIKTVTRYPLALAQAASYICMTGISISDYIQRYQEYKETLLNRGTEDDPHSDTLLITVTLCLEALQSEQAEKIFRRKRPVLDETLNILQICSYLHAETPIPYRFLKCFIHERIMADDAAVPLLKMSLLQHAQASHVKIHAMTQQICMLKPDSTEKKQMLLWIIAHFITYFKEVLPEIVAEKSNASLLTHISALKKCVELLDIPIDEQLSAQMQVLNQCGTNIIRAVLDSMQRRMHELMSNTGFKPLGRMGGGGRGFGGF